MAKKITDIDTARQKRKVQIQKEKKKKIRNGILLLVILWLGWQMIEPQNFFFALESKVKSSLSQDRYPVKIGGGNLLKVDQLNGLPIALSSSDLSVIDEKGYVQNYKKHTLKRPKLSINGNHFMVFDQGEFTLFLGNQYRTREPITLPYKILNGTMGSNGFYSIVTESEKYLNEVVVYNQKDEEVYRWYSATEYVANVIFCPGESQMLVHGISSEGGSIRSVVYLLDLNSPKEVSKVDLKDNYPLEILPFATFMRIVGETSITDVDFSGKILRTANFENQSLIDFGVHGNYIAVGISGAKNSYFNTMKIFDGNLQEVSSFHVENLIVDMDFNTKELVILSESALMVFDTKGNKIKEKQINNGSAQVMFSKQSIITNTKETLYQQHF